MLQKQIYTEIKLLQLKFWSFWFTTHTRCHKNSQDNAQLYKLANVLEEKSDSNAFWVTDTL